MGEVYPAHDTHLTPSCCSQDSSGLFAAAAAQLTRFKREAQILALLNHTNIATIHSADLLPLESEDGSMELSEMQRLKHGVAFHLERIAKKL